MTAAAEVKTGTCLRCRQQVELVGIEEGPWLADHERPGHPGEELCAGSGEEPAKCDYCGTSIGQIDVHSGSLECSPCWYDRKMNLPAARHWLPAAEAFLSNIDAWDFTVFVPTAIEEAIKAVGAPGTGEADRITDSRLRYAGEFLRDNVPALAPDMEDAVRRAFAITIHVAAAMEVLSRRMVEGGEKHVVTRRFP